MISMKKIVPKRKICHSFFELVEMKNIFFRASKPLRGSENEWNHFSCGKQKERRFWMNKI